jgi:hypothetical protein
MSPRTPNEILKSYKKRIHRGEAITPGQVYDELSHDEWFEFTMTTIRLKTPEMQQFMNKVYEHAGDVIDDIFGVCHWKTHKIRCIKSLKTLSPERLKDYNRFKAHNCRLSKKRWINWCV